MADSTAAGAGISSSYAKILYSRERRVFIFEESRALNMHGV
ncbi:hypothetical protein CCACVL1_17041 [Corchorus capsularis]|uniref:Uncharacterized protein n=2 Tax=Corchorus TaxID=93758 RepID=A0A1R3HUU6_COCAP|nr:hypothetical protein COLO4_32579 [Corchorus olitorius]OMO73961.1 hypothetical protein CCACVL1_17041 [Corchorus capsularis]